MKTARWSVRGPALIAGAGAVAVADQRHGRSCTVGGAVVGGVIGNRIDKDKKK